MKNSIIEKNRESCNLEEQINSLVLELKHSHAESQISRSLTAFHQWTEGMLAEIFNNDLSGSESNIDCRAGCGHCCLLTVRILPVEAATIRHHLKQNVSAESFQSIVTMARKLERDMDYLDDLERQMLRKSCPFLDEEKRCLIHPVRPLLCRSVSSIRAEDCLDAITALSFDECLPVMMHLGQKDFFDSAYISLSTALTEAGLSGESTCLTSAVAAF